MQAKEQFIAQKELAAWWSSISNDTRFDTMMKGMKPGRPRRLVNQNH
jgi:hypothetical protein